MKQTTKQDKMILDLLDDSSVNPVNTFQHRGSGKLDEALTENISHIGSYINALMDAVSVVQKTKDRKEIIRMLNKLHEGAEECLRHDTELKKMLKKQSNQKIKRRA